MVTAQLITLIGISYVFVIKILCLLFGYWIVKLGAELLREGVTGGFKFQTELQGLKADLAGASPGLLFVLLGTILIGYAVWVPKNVDVTAKPASTINSPPSVPIPKG